MQIRSIDRKRDREKERKNRREIRKIPKDRLFRGIRGGVWETLGRLNLRVLGGFGDLASWRRNSRDVWRKKKKKKTME